MLPSPTAGAVLYAADAARLSAFYSALIGFRVLHADDDYVLLRFEAFELVVLTTAESRAGRAAMGHPPTRRTKAALKPVFFVSDLASARALGGQLGGSLNPPGDEWRFQDFIVCDGLDPEGNVIQLRQPAEQSEQSERSDQHLVSDASGG